LNNLAMILSDRGETADAEKLAARAAAREHPRQASFYDTLATVQAKTRQWEQAGASIGKALQLEPTNVGFQIHRAVILVSAGDPAKARQALDAVQGLRPDDPRLSDTDRERLKSLQQRAAAGL
jgi:Flp pilus assembly protein TadD